MVSGGLSEHSKIEVIIFVLCVSNRDSGSPKVAFVAGHLIQVYVLYLTLVSLVWSVEQREG